VKECFLNRGILQSYVSPTNGTPLVLLSSEQAIDGEIIEGILYDESTNHEYSIRSGIPRFVEGTNYADNFSLQWNRYKSVQLDSVNGSTLTRDRFYEGTGWKSDEMKSARVLEAGCGAGRFSEIILETEAELYSFDFSSAVDAAWLNNQHYPNFNLCQADIYAMPYHKNWFDFVFCYGVLQHTPNPKQAFMGLTSLLKPGGQIAIDVYARETQLTKLAAKYWYRPITKRIPNRLLLKVFSAYLPFWTPIDSLLHRIPGIGKYLAVLVPCWNKSGLPLSREHRLEWTILDTFDAFSCEFDQPHSVLEVQAWFEDAGLTDIFVRSGGNGVLGNGRKP